MRSVKAAAIAAKRTQPAAKDAGSTGDTAD
jgi:hypothetical protein